MTWKCVVGLLCLAAQGWSVDLVTSDGAFEKGSDMPSMSVNFSFDVTEITSEYIVEAERFSQMDNAAFEAVMWRTNGGLPWIDGNPPAVIEEAWRRKLLDMPTSRHLWKWHLDQLTTLTGYDTDQRGIYPRKNAGSLRYDFSVHWLLVLSTLKGPLQGDASDLLVKALDDLIAVQAPMLDRLADQDVAFQYLVLANPAGLAAFPMCTGGEARDRRIAWIPPGDSYRWLGQEVDMPNAAECRDFLDRVAELVPEALPPGNGLFPPPEEQRELNFNPGKPPIDSAYDLDQPIAKQYLVPWPMIRWWATRLTAHLQRLRDPAAPWNRIAVALERIDAWSGRAPTPSEVIIARHQSEILDFEDEKLGVSVGNPVTEFRDEDLLAAAVIEVQAPALWRRQPDRPLRAARLLAALGGDQAASALIAVLATDLPALRAEPAEAARRRALLVAAAARLGRGVMAPVLAQAVHPDAHVENLAAILDAACGRAAARAMIEVLLPAATVEQQAGYRRLLDALDN